MTDYGKRKIGKEGSGRPVGMNPGWTLNGPCTILEWTLDASAGAPEHGRLLKRLGKRKRVG